MSALSSAAHDSRHARLRAQLDGAVTLLDVIELAGRRIVIAGSSFGGAGAWALAYGSAATIGLVACVS